MTSRRTLIVAAATAAASAACTPAASPCPFANAPVPGVRDPAPPPFTREQIRSGMRPGRKDRYLLVAFSHAFGPTLNDVQVVSAKDDMYELSQESHEVPGWVHGEATIRVRTVPPSSWLDVMAHARWFDRASTHIYESACKTPIGNFDDCLVYVRREGRSYQDYFFYAYYVKSLPGPPVMEVMVKCRALVYYSALVSHTAPPTTQLVEPTLPSTPAHTAPRP